MIALISEENKEYEEITQEMKKNIQLLKEDLSKKQGLAELHYKYEKKIKETHVATIIRTNNQERLDIKKEKETVIELRKREIAVFQKISKTLNNNIEELTKDIDDWRVIEL